MKRTLTASLLLAIQLVLVLSIAAKYLYERHTRPRVWVVAGVYDPSQPLRGRYLALQLRLNSCALPHDPKHFEQGFPIFDEGRPTAKHGPGRWNWDVSLETREGKLLPVLDEDARDPSKVAHLSHRENSPCDLATLSPGVEYFIPDTARPPSPLKPNQFLWVEVTVPAEGPPRPIQLALSDSSGFHTLNLN